LTQRFSASRPKTPRWAAATWAESTRARLAHLVELLLLLVGQNISQPLVYFFLNRGELGLLNGAKP
jgi:hypothetical protein